MSGKNVQTDFFIALFEKIMSIGVATYYQVVRFSVHSPEYGLCTFLFGGFKMKKRILSLILFTLIFISGVEVIGATEKKYEDLTYYISNGCVFITGCSSSATTVEIPEKIENKPVTRIDDLAFYNCNSLISVTIPNNISSIGSFAFMGCESLMNITVSECTTNIPLSESSKGIEAEAFSNCKNLTNVTIPEKVLNIGCRAFENCTNLVSIIIPNNVTNIEQYAFSGCESLKNITIPESITNIGTAAFNNCKSLTAVTIPGSVTTIANSAFRDCTNLTDVIILNGVTNINFGAFQNCTNLTNITIPDSVTNISSAFRSCTSLTNVNITSLEAWCKISFNGSGSNPLCYAKRLNINGNFITDIIIPDTVTSISAEAFYNFEGLTSVIIPNSVNSIDVGAFQSCKALTSIDLGEGIGIISRYTFYNCQNLKYIHLSENLSEIEEGAFAECPKIQLVFYAGSEEQWKNISKDIENENLTNAKIIYRSKKKNYHFETNCDNSISDINDYAVFDSPIVKNGNMKLEGWYENSNFSGTPISFPYYGDSTTLYAKWIEKDGSSFDEAFYVKDNNKYISKIKEEGQIIYYQFVPRYTGEYHFFSKGNNDTCGYLYDSKKNQIFSDNDNGEENNFSITYNLTAGETYYIGVKFLNGTGDFTLYIESDFKASTNTICVSAVSNEKIFITTPHYLPDNAQIILACYDSFGKLIELQSNKNNNNTLYFIVSKKFDNAKIMVWENLSLNPLCEAEEIITTQK